MHIDPNKLAKIWGAAMFNSRFASISLRSLMVVITHSLGGGVALGALFNTTHKRQLFNLVTPEAA